MNEWMVLVGVAMTAASGVPGLFLDRRRATGERIAVAMMALGAAAGIAGAARAFAAPSLSPSRVSWAVPGGELAFRVDAIAAMFLIQIFIIALLGAIFGLEYWKQSEHEATGRKLRLFYGLLTAGLALLVAAHNTMLFIAGWEVMALACFLLVTTEDGDRAVREVGYLYLVATRIGTLCLFGLLALLFAATGVFEWVAPPSTNLANGMFLLAVFGFGIKAGIMPMHVWLPGAHANAPSHVSALMSGVLIKMGVYGMVRFTSLFATPPLWWGALVLALGVVSAILGVAFALGQHDLKRLLAYHSVENIGIIWMGLGTAMLGRSLGRSDLVALGLAGALLHTWNHGLFKALLFFSAGSVIHAAHTREIDHLGGLSRAMPSTALYFVVGAVAICGLPPLNGFVSELFVYLGLFRAALSSSGRLWLAGALAAPALALVGALAVACFVKVYGAVFLGEPRSQHARAAHESGRSMRAPMAALAALCLFIGVGAPLVAPVLDGAVRAWAPGFDGQPIAALAPLGWVSIAAVALFLAIAAAGWFLASRTRSPAPAVGTWDCGYALPSPTMQYSASSFAQTLVSIFSFALRPDEKRPHLRAVFPHGEGFHSRVPEAVLDLLLLPFARLLARAFVWMRWIQRGNVQGYLLYILLTLVVFFFVWR